MRLRIACYSEAVSKVADRILKESAGRRLAIAIGQLAGPEIALIESSLPCALAGDRAQVRIYVLAYRNLTERMLEAVGEARPDLLSFDRSHTRLFVSELKVSARPAGTVSWIKGRLEGEALSAPFNEWVGTLGVGAGAAVGLVAHLRDVLPGTEPLPSPRDRQLPEWNVDDKGVVRFYRAVVDELEAAEAPLERMRSVMGLSQTELAALFGVSRQAVDRWLEHGVPAERQEKLATLGEIVDLLSAKLSRDRIPGVVRRAAAAYGDRTILEAIAAGEQDAVLDELRDAFDWSLAA